MGISGHLRDRPIGYVVAGYHQRRGQQRLSLTLLMLLLSDNALQLVILGKQMRREERTTARKNLTVQRTQLHNNQVKVVHNQRRIMQIAN